MWLVVLWRQLGGRPVIAGFHYLVGVSCDLVYGMRVPEGNGRLRKVSSQRKETKKIIK